MQDEIVQLCYKLGSPDGTIENIPAGPVILSVKGMDSVVSSGFRYIELKLQGDVVSADALTFYGALDDGGKGWHPYSINFQKTTDAGTDYLDLVDVTDSGTGVLLAITRDGKGRITGTRDATITGTSGRITVAHGDASDGVPTIDLETLADGGGGTLLRIDRDSFGRVLGTSTPTTDDLAEGSTNLYFTDERAQDAVGSILDGTGNVPLTYDDAGNKISAALSSGVLASLALADSSLQPGDNVSELTNDAGYVDAAGASAAAPVQSVNGATGTVSLSAADVGAVATIVAGTNITVDATDPQNPIVSASGGGGSGTVTSVAVADTSEITWSGSPITTSGTLTPTLSTNLQDWSSTPTADKEDAISAGTTSQYWRGDKTWQDIDSIFTPGYIDGMQMKWVSGTALTLSSGAAYIEGSSEVLRVSSDIAKTGLSMSASTWYHVYLYENAGTPDIEIVTTAPSSPYNGTARSKTGDTSRRYVGSVRVDSTGNIHKIRHNWSTGEVDYLIDINNADLHILNNGSSASDTTVSAATAAPVTSRSMIAFAENNGTGGVAEISNADAGSPINTHILAFLRSNRSLAGQIQLTSSQTFTYFCSSGSLLTVYAVGYIFER